MNMRASVIIVVYNAGVQLRHCIESLSNGVPDDCEILVVDNASTDGSADFLRAGWGGIRLIEPGQNLGFGAGCNLAAQKSRADFLVFLNPDTVAEQGWLEALLAPLLTDPSVGLSTAKIVLGDQPELINACGNDVHLTGITLCRGLGKRRDDFGVVDEDVSAVSGASFAISRELFDGLGGFDEDMFLYMEDTDLSLRARLAGRSCRCVSESVVRHNYRLRIGPQKVFYQERNRYLMLIKLFHAPTLVALLPSLAVGEVVSWGFVLLRDQQNIANKLRAYAWILQNLRSIASKKVATQARRQRKDRELLAGFDFRLQFEQAASPTTARLAHLVFDPLFWALKELTLTLVRW
jgi:GT2 family glycosyltransferase